MGFPNGSEGKESTCNSGDPGVIPGLGRSPGEGNGNPLQYSRLENPHGQRSLAGYSPWGHKESDTTERLSTAPPRSCCPQATPTPPSPGSHWAGGHTSSLDLRALSGHQVELAPGAGLVGGCVPSCDFLGLAPLASWAESTIWCPKHRACSQILGLP